MDMLKRLTVLAAFALSAFALSGCALDGLDTPPDVTLVDFQLRDVALLEQTADVVLRIRNPNDTALSVDGYRFTLAVNGQPLARGTSGETLTVPRLGEVTTRARASISTLDLMRQVTAAEAADGIGYQLSGTLFLAGGLRRELPFEQSGRLSGSDFRDDGHGGQN